MILGSTIHQTFFLILPNEPNNSYVIALILGLMAVCFFYLISILVADRTISTYPLIIFAGLAFTIMFAYTIPTQDKYEFQMESIISNQTTTCSDLQTIGLERPQFKDKVIDELFIRCNLTTLNQTALLQIIKGNENE